MKERTGVSIAGQYFYPGQIAKLRKAQEREAGKHPSGLSKRARRAVVTALGISEELAFCDAWNRATARQSIAAVKFYELLRFPNCSYQTALEVWAWAHAWERFESL